MKKIRIIHIVKDDKFIDEPLCCFGSDERFENKAILIVDTPEYKFRRIKNVDIITVVYRKNTLKKILKRDDYDAVFFYSLSNYRIINYIPKGKIILWWAWGYDLYGPERFIDIPLYKPSTQKYLSNINTSYLSYIKNYLRHIPWVWALLLTLRQGRRDNAIKRIDYFQPVIHPEYELMQHYPGFRAKEFYYPMAHSFKSLIEESDIPTHGNSLIINHSASITANHLDVWESVKRFIPQSSTIYIPINYGNKDYAKYLSQKIVSEYDNIQFITDFLSPEKYFSLLDSCSYAVFGFLRQEGMGNIYRCLAKGVKVFLFKDSVDYKYLKDLGCSIYAIEDINMDSFKTPLSATDARINQQCLYKEERFVNDISESAIMDIYRHLK